MVSRFLREILGLGMGCCVGAALLVGCGGSGNLAPVTGTVTHNGSPVTGGELTFTPVQTGEGASTARPASATIQPDGTFAAMTEKAGDGASVGKHLISYSAPSDSADRPEWDGSGSPPEVAKSPFLGLVPAVPQVDVAAGKNELKIELVSPPPPTQE